MVKIFKYYLIPKKSYDTWSKRALANPVFAILGLSATDTAVQWLSICGIISIIHCFHVRSLRCQSKHTLFRSS